MRRLAQRPILYHAVICGFIEYTTTASGCFLKTMIGGPPVPQYFPIPLDFQNQIQPRACHKIATLRAGNGVKRVKKRGTDDISFEGIQVTINLVDAPKGSDEYPFVAIYHSSRHFEI